MMGKPVNSKVDRAPTTALNTKVDKEVLDNFKDYCKYLGYPMNVLLETFMRQYADGNFDLNRNDIIKWKVDDYEVDTLNTTFNKEIYLDFKSMCKENGYFVKHVITAFMEKLTNENLVLEYVETKEINDED